MNPLQELLYQKALTYKQLSKKGTTNDHFFESLFEGADSKIVKNVCAKISVPLSDELDNVCGLLNITKRQFIESAIVHALDESKNVMRELDLFDEVELQK